MGNGSGGRARRSGAAIGAVLRASASASPAPATTLAPRTSLATFMGAFWPPVRTAVWTTIRATIVMPPFGLIVVGVLVLTRVSIGMGLPAPVGHRWGAPLLVVATLMGFVMLALARVRLTGAVLADRCAGLRPCATAALAASAATATLLAAGCALAMLLAVLVRGVVLAIWRVRGLLRVCIMIALGVWLGACVGRRLALGLRSRYGRTSAALRRLRGPLARLARAFTGATASASAPATATLLQPAALPLGSLGLLVVALGFNGLRSGALELHGRGLVVLVGGLRGELGLIVPDVDLSGDGGLVHPVFDGGVLLDVLEGRDLNVCAVLFVGVERDTIEGHGLAHTDLDVLAAGAFYA